MGAQRRRRHFNSNSARRFNLRFKTVGRGAGNALSTITAGKRYGLPAQLFGFEILRVDLRRRWDRCARDSLIGPAIAERGVRVIV